MNELEKQYYNAVNRDVNSDIVQKWRTKNKTFLNYLASLDKKIKILEIGAGRGFVTKYLKDRGCNIIGSDFNKKNLELAKKINNVDLIYLDATDIKLNEKFDVIISTDLVEHLPNVEKHIKEVRKILKFQGQYCFTTPNRYLEEVYNVIKGGKIDKFHISLQSFISLKKLFGKFGFSVKFLHAKEFTLSQKSKLGKISKLIPIKFLPKIIQPSILCIAKYEKN